MQPTHLAPALLSRPGRNPSTTHVLLQRSQWKVPASSVDSSDLIGLFSFPSTDVSPRQAARRNVSGMPLVILGRAKSRCKAVELLRAAARRGMAAPRTPPPESLSTDDVLLRRGVAAGMSKDAVTFSAARRGVGRGGDAATVCVCVCVRTSKVSEGRHHRRHNDDLPPRN